MSPSRTEPDAPRDVRFHFCMKNRGAFQWKRTPVIFVLYPAAAAHSKAQPRTTQAAHNVGQL